MKQINTLKHKIIQLLARLDFFKDFTATEKTLLVDGKGMIVLAEEGEYVIKEGTVDPTLYIPLSGELEVRMTNETGKEITLAKIPPGETVGEVAFLTDTPRTASVVAIKQTLLFRCNRAALKNLAPAAREKIKDQIIYKLIERLHQKNVELSNRG
ncbi:cyclic nucleotide-binding domain-containing protein [Marinospirillum alkaliphilum]|uniref:Cyclic nucleotide-binding domain-containing protein n=1 Tax=Marinospirillum alkaliphilum DSM 21637 TaxID=1122209 RepID=A0A1K1WKJ9_9GAMM|nr:cyclic nucleotide-binding domain-containing protein [Marinospirillum alkaliphilum]SFX37325.1 Cyclic nucleotide-binding domain-containing protein [Marinospirillum alkaliphilum DSM 21637]